VVFGIEWASATSYHGLFKAARYSYQKPKAFDHRRGSDAEVARQTGEVRDKLDDLRKDPSVVILAADEVHVFAQTEVRQGWMPRGHRDGLAGGA
jgi:hypothetical protein